MEFMISNSLTYAEQGAYHCRMFVAGCRLRLAHRLGRVHLGTLIGMLCISTRVNPGIQPSAGLIYTNPTISLADANKQMAGLQAVMEKINGTFLSVLMPTYFQFFQTFLVPTDVVCSILFHLSKEGSKLTLVISRSESRSRSPHD